MAESEFGKRACWLINRTIWCINCKSLLKIVQAVPKEILDCNDNTNTYHAERCVECQHLNTIKTKVGKLRSMVARLASQ